MNELDPQVIFLMGPTASGKTDLAIRMCQHFPVEVISVDSALIYKGMDIGTAKPSQQERQLAPHRLIDIVDPAMRYSVADFRRDALQAIQEILQSGKIPLLVGGTMLYFKALLEGLSPLPEADQQIRKEIEQQAQLEGWGTLHEALKQFDPISAERIHPNDPQRLTRAIEVFRISGKSLTELSQLQGEKFPYKVKQYALLADDRAVLHQRIAERFHRMMEAGFEQEVRSLFSRTDLHPDLPAMRCVGYRQMWAYLQGEMSKEQAIERGIIATRQLAKRQMTWLRGWPEVTYLSCENSEHAFEIISQTWSSC